MIEKGIVEVAFSCDAKDKKGLWLKLNADVPFEWEKIGDRYFLDLSSADKPATPLDKTREKHPQAYASWTNELDDRLEVLYSEGKTTKELCKILGRQPGAIRSRIKKLELKEIYKG